MPVRPLVKIFLGASQLPAGADQLSAARSKSATARSTASTSPALAGRPPVRGGVPEPPGPGVQLGGGPVQRFLRRRRAGYAPRSAAPPRCVTWPSASVDRRGPGSSRCARPRSASRPQHLLPLGGQVLPLPAQVRDQPVEFGEPGAAPAGPVGRPDVLRRGLGPGAQLHPVAVLRPGVYHGAPPAPVPPGCRAPAAVPGQFVRNENRRAALPRPRPAATRS